MLVVNLERGAADFLGLAAGGGTDIGLVVDASNNVGIGITSPDEKLHVANTSGGASILIETNNSSGGNILFGDDASNTVGRVQYVHSDDSMRLFTASSERMRIDSSGNVGIGTTSPGSLLNIRSTLPEFRISSSDTSHGIGDEVGRLSIHTQDATTPGAGEVFRIKTESASSIGADYTTRLTNRTGAGGGQTELSLGNGQGSIYFSTNTTGNNASARMAVMSSGNVGIGTTSPQNPLTVAGNGDTAIDIVADLDNNGTNNWPILNFKRNSVSATPAARIYQKENDNAFVIDNNGSERMRIDSSGNDSL